MPGLGGAVITGTVITSGSGAMAGNDWLGSTGDADGTGTGASVGRTGMAITGAGETTATGGGVSDDAGGMMTAVAGGQVN